MPIRARAAGHWGGGTYPSPDSANQTWVVGSVLSGRCSRPHSWQQSGQTTGDTSIFITPGFEFRVVDQLITNFHLPKSSLMMLVSAFAGFDKIRALYDHAIREQYRFFSYGDAMLLTNSNITGDIKNLSDGSKSA